MSGAAQAKAADTTRRKYERNGVRPDYADPNSPRLKFGWLTQHALYPSLAIVLKAIYSLKPTELPNGRGLLLRDGSVTRIAAATARHIPGYETVGGAPAMHHRTVAHCLEALTKKGFLQRWDVEPRAKTSPFGTHWRLPRYDEILQRWADDPKIATIGDKRAFYVIGKGRHHATPEEVVAWKMDHTLAQRLPSAQAIAADVEEPLSANEAKSVLEYSEIEAAHFAICEVIEVHDNSGRKLIDGINSTPEDAAKLIEQAREAAPGIPVEAVAALIKSIRIEKWKADQHSRKPAFIVVGWLKTKITAAAHAWRLSQRDRATA
jgi:hypothetical protein